MEKQASMDYRCELKFQQILILFVSFHALIYELYYDYFRAGIKSNKNKMRDKLVNYNQRVNPYSKATYIFIFLKY